ncbi:hypothetical protein BKA63DRAFT_594951 [Paraphoma chrysanthemicola]|nr:hypothetical protein BKA63DRAFT_594951 [Paraphoma chrysanthemicola]
MFESLRTDIRIKSTKRLYEMISAWPVDSQIDSPGSISFTQALPDSLTDFAATNGSRPFSTTQINQRIRMVPGRESTASQFRPLFTNERRIALSSKQGTETTQKQFAWPFLPARSYLKLGFAVRDDHLNEKQVELLTRNLANALKDKRILGLRKIDWLGIDVRPTVQLEQTGCSRTAFARWKNVLYQNQMRRRWVFASTMPLDVEMPPVSPPSLHARISY